MEQTQEGTKLTAVDPSPQNKLIPTPPKEEGGSLDHQGANAAVDEVLRFSLQLMIVPDYCKDIDYIGSL